MMKRLTLQEIKTRLSTISPEPLLNRVADLLARLQDSGLSVESWLPTCSTSKPSVTVRAEPGIVAFTCNDDEANASVCLEGQAGEWAFLHMTRAAESPDADLIDLYGPAVTNSSSPRRIINLNNLIKSTLAKKIPQLELELKCTMKSRRYQGPDGLVRSSSHRITWQSEAKMSGPLFTAVEHMDNAKASLSNRHYEDALDEAVRGIECCPYLFPLYAAFAEAINRRGSRALSAEAVSVLLRGITSIEQWLQRLTRGLDQCALPAQYHEVIRAHCRQELDARLAKLSALRTILGKGASASHVSGRNPVNPVLDAYESALAGVGDNVQLNPDDILDAAETEAFYRIASSVKEAIAASPAYSGWEASSGQSAVHELLNEENLHRALICIAQSTARYRFPEPHEQPDTWETATVKQWSMVALGKDEEEELDKLPDHKKVNYETLKDVLSTASMVAGAAMRTNHMKPNRLGSSHY
jgi:hypothetical protein